MQTRSIRIAVLLAVGAVGGAIVGCSARDSAPTEAKRPAASGPKAQQQSDAEREDAARRAAEAAAKAAAQAAARAAAEKAALEERMAKQGSAGAMQRPDDIDKGFHLSPLPPIREPKSTSLPKAKPAPAIKSDPSAKPDVPDRPKVDPAPATPDVQPPSEDDSAYTVVKVYYATDRAPTDVSAWQDSLRGGWPRLATVTAALAVVVAIWARRRPERRALRRLGWCLVALTLLLGGLTLAYRVAPAMPGGQVERMYGNERGELELGTCEVSIPKEHEVGEMESPSVLRLEFREDPERHIVLRSVNLSPADEFYADVRSCVGRSPGKEAFVFIHGYNVGFATAARRTAQIAYDLKFAGAPIFYSWPSQEGLLAYTVDETNVAWTVPHLKQFLSDVARKSGARAVHLVAHSMGNRALTSALRELSLELKGDCPRFHEIVLTAPDVDADVFRRDIAPAIVGLSDRVTLYASSNDEALAASKAIHGYRRAGDSGNDIVIVPGIDTVDVSDVDTSLIGHSYYGSNRTVLADLFEVIHGSKPADQRKWLRSMQQGLLTYWKFLRDAASPPTKEE